DILKWQQDNDSLRKTFYRLDHGDWAFEPDKFPLSADESEVDHLLYIYDVIGYYAEKGIIKDDTLPIIRFEASRVIHNPQVDSYLKWLDTRYKDLRIPGSAYIYARRLGKKIAQPQRKS